VFAVQNEKGLQLQLGAFFVVGQSYNKIKLIRKSSIDDESLWGFLLSYDQGEGTQEELAERFLVTQHLVVIRLDYWLTPLARKPPSTTNVCPVTKEAASEAR
jgi:hypothetical protein